MDTISIPKISKENNSAKNVGGVTVVDLCTSSGNALYFYQVSGVIKFFSQPLVQDKWPVKIHLS